MATDASGSWGCGAWHHKAWFQIQWPEQEISLDIAQKELIPIILACDTWGAAWHGQQILCHCDNQVVVACLKRCLTLVEACHLCYLHPTYISTRANFLADDLSWDKISAKCQGLTSVHPLSPSSFWTCCWAVRWSGRFQPGGSNAAVFSGGTSPLHSSNLPHSHETVQCLLYHIPHHQPLPPNRTLDVLLRILPG